jgi:SRSO17 transposase
MHGLAHVVRWAADLETLHRRIAGRFARSEQRGRSLAYLKALLSPVERKNGWQMAEQIGEATPDGVQRLLNAADWSADTVRDDLRSYVTEHLGDAEAVLVVDETGFVKKGDKSVGVQRQYCGAAGRIENCQVGVFLCYASRHGGAFLDRALYLPKDWALNPERRREAGVPSWVRFRTKPELAREMLERAMAAGVPFRWVTGDAVYGSDRRLRLFLEQNEQWFVLAVPSNELLMWGGPSYHRADALTAAVSAEQWQRLSAGDGAKGPRVDDWALVELWRLQLTAEQRQWGHYLLARRSVEKPEEIAYYVVFCPRAQALLETLARVAGSRWQIEVGFEGAKGACGLDQYEVRKWAAWHRHITLSLLAHAFLAAMRAREGPEGREEAEEEKGAVPLLAA